MEFIDELNIIVSGTAPELYPTEVFFALVAANPDDFIEVPKMYPFNFGWGCVGEISIPTNSKHEMPLRLDMVYLSVCEKRFYSIESDINSMRISDAWSSNLYDTILVGMAPYGEVAIWLSGHKKTYFVQWFIGEEVDIDIATFYPSNPLVTLAEICDSTINNDPQVKENLENNGLPPRDLFDRYMQQFNYRYVVELGHWDDEKKEWKEYEGDETKPEFDYIEEALFDGTHDKLHDGGLMKYHEAGKPKKLALQWHIKKSDYSAYLWFDDIAIRSAFEQFCYKYPEAKMDFTFHIDPGKKVFQLSLNCDEAEEPMPLSEDSYQMIIFKSKFEYYRTANYNQPRGAWIW